MEINDIKKIIREGTILVTRRRMSLYVHLGIVAIEDDQMFIYDLHMDHDNEENGNIESHSLEDYMKLTNKLVGIYHTDTPTARIKMVAEKCWTKKYDKYEFNCQKFIDTITNNEVRSDLYSFYAPIIITSVVVGFGLVGLAVGLMIKGSKK